MYGPMTGANNHIQILMLTTSLQKNRYYTSVLAQKSIIGIIILKHLRSH